MTSTEPESNPQADIQRDPVARKWNSIGLPFDRDAIMFVVPLIVISAIGVYMHVWWLWVPMALLAFAILMFFRDPPRTVCDEPGVVVSPADGKIAGIEENTDPERGPVPGHRVIIFLSVLNCHINRASCAGTVTKLEYKRGSMLNALNPESSEKNERNSVFIDCGTHNIMVRQITGLIARRIICRLKEGQALARGERFGLIRFGSRTELYLPAHAELAVKEGDSVKGGLTRIAQFKT